MLILEKKASSCFLYIIISIAMEWKEFDVRY